MSHKKVHFNVDKKGLGGIADCNGLISHLTRPIKSMSSKGFAKGRFDKRKWSKRVRGYFKCQNKEIL